MPAGFAIATCILFGTATGLLSGIGAADGAASVLALCSLALIVDRPLLRRALLLGIAFGIGLTDGGWARARAMSSPMLDWFATGAPDDHGGDATVVHGSLSDDATAGENGVRLNIDVDRIRAAGAWLPLPGRVQAHLTLDPGVASGVVGDWTAGRTITAPVVLRMPQTWNNPGSPSPAWQRLRRTTDLVGTIKSASLVDVQPAPAWDEMAARVRRHVRAACARYLAPRSTQSAAIVAAILIGDRAGLAVDVQRRLRTAGTFHVIAISGGNVALLTVMCFALLGLVIRSFRTLALLVIVLVVGYGWLVGGDPSVRRAVAAAVLYLALSLVGLMPRALHVLSTVAVALALIDPLIVIDVGAWLSFGATLGIVLCASRFVAWARPKNDLGGRSSKTVRRAPRSFVVLWEAILGLFSATLAAELILLPISAAVFSRVSVFGLVLNFIAIPAMAVVQIAGIIMVGCAGWWNRGASLAALVSDVAASLLVGSSSVVDAAPWLSWRVPPVSLWWTLAFYAGYAGFLSYRIWTPARGVAIAIAGVSLAVIITAPTVELAAPRDGTLRVTMIDVGQGDSVLVQFPMGQSLLVDAGGARGGTDFGARVVTPALWALGVRRLDWLAITHGDIDHAGGAIDVAHDFQPREIWESVPVPNNPELRALRIDAHAQHIVWRQLLAGHTFEVGSVKVEVLHPPAPDWERQRVRNDDSLVLRLGFGDVDVVLTGDAGREFESLPQAPSHAPLRLLKVGHHGSRSSSTETFVGSFRPDVAFVSAGRGNVFGHPAPDVIARYERLGAKVFRTDQDGAIVIETDGAKVIVTTMTGRRWRFTAARE